MKDGNAALFISERPAQGKWEGPVEYEDFDRTAYYPSWAVNAQGDLCLVASVIGDDRGVDWKMICRPVGGEWGTGDFLTDEDHRGGKDSPPAVVLDNQGNFYALWSEKWDDEVKILTYTFLRQIIKK